MPLDKDAKAQGFAKAFFKHPLPQLPEGFPNGWMSARDLLVIYNAARRSGGDILEVGPWLGRSSSAIAAGLRDREADGHAPVKYDTIDFGITSAAEWTDRFAIPFDVDKDKGRVAEAVYHPGGTIAVLIRNLRNNGLLPYVTNVIRGDFLDSPISRRYGMIFCDATHDDAEIHRHVPRLAELAAPGCVLVFDDVISEARADLICGYLDTKRRFLTRAVDPGKTARRKLLVVETSSKKAVAT